MLWPRWPGYWFLPYKLQAFHSKHKGHFDSHSCGFVQTNLLRDVLGLAWNTSAPSTGKQGLDSTFGAREIILEAFPWNCRNQQTIGNAGLSKSQMESRVPICNSKSSLHFPTLFLYAKGYARNLCKFKTAHCHCMHLKICRSQQPFLL